MARAQRRGQQDLGLLPEDLFSPESFYSGSSERSEATPTSLGIHANQRVSGKSVEKTGQPGTMGQNGLSQVIGLVSEGKIKEENVSIFKFSLLLKSVFGCGFLWLMTDSPEVSRSLS